MAKNDVDPGDYHETSLSTFRNWLSIVGGVVSVWGFTGFGFSFVMDLAPGESSAYSAINMIPSLAVVALGGALIVVGALLEARRRRSGLPPSLSHTVTLEVGMSFTLLLLVGTVAVTLAVRAAGTGASHVYEFTESNEFCGQTCHEVMEPEWVAFQDGPHSRLDCVGCHIGPKVDSYLTYKFNGLRQLAAVATNSYQRPIPTPVESLRQAREICEHCHSADRFTEYRESTHSYFLADEDNTRFEMRLLMKTGGGDRGFVQGSGVHYHMVVAAGVEYVARDPQRQQIPWVRVTRADGTVTEYEDGDEPLDEAEREELETHNMDCLDCHVRPAHRFEAPVVTVNQAIEAGAISRDLPYVKLRSVAALDSPYATRTEALAGIEADMTEYYETEYPEVTNGRRESLATSIAAVQKIYQRQFFPEMKVSWRAHPDNIGHRDSPGCFRCHNDRMESPDGDTLVMACNTCHLILAQGENVESVRIDGRREELFFHPDDQDYLDDYTDCSDCHTGGADLYE